jgi:hypothetical protein
VTAGETHRAIEATFRIERAGLIAGLAEFLTPEELSTPRDAERGKLGIA